MRNGPVLWEEILRIARNYGGNPIIAGGAVRDYVILKSQPKDIDVFLQGPIPAGIEIDGMVYRDNQFNNFPEYMGRGGIQGIREYGWPESPYPIQFIWTDDDPVQYVKGFDLGTSQCYYRGAAVLGKNFLYDWHHQTITMLPQAFQRPGGEARTRERAEVLRRKYPDGAAIREVRPEQEGPQAVQNELAREMLWPVADAQAQERHLAAARNLREWGVRLRPGVRDMLWGGQGLGQQPQGEEQAE